jgi:hypothetical protein
VETLCKKVKMLAKWSVLVQVSWAGDSTNSELFFSLLTTACPWQMVSLNGCHICVSLARTVGLNNKMSLFRNQGHILLTCLMSSWGLWAQSHLEAVFGHHSLAHVKVPTLWLHMEPKGMCRKGGKGLGQGTSVAWGQRGHWYSWAGHCEPACGALRITKVVCQETKLEAK